MKDLALAQGTAFSNDAERSYAQVAVIDDNTIEVNGEQYSFDPRLVEYDPSGPIFEAHRDSTGVLYVTVLRQYSTNGWPSWDDMQFHSANIGNIA